jgi:hypothetical protein
MSIITKKVRSLVPNKIGDSITTITANSPISSLLPALNAYAAQLQERQAGYDALILAMSSSSEYLEDNEDVDARAGYSPRFVSTDQETCEMILDGFKNASSLLSTAPEGAGGNLTITSMAGQTFSLQHGAWTDPSTGVTTYLRNITKTGTVALITEDVHGEWKINTRFCPITANYSDAISGAFDSGQTIQSLFDNICAYNGINTAGMTISRMALAVKSKLSLSATDDILSIARAVATHYGVKVSEQIQTTLQSVIDKLRTDPNQYIFENGASILKGCVASGELNSYITLATQAICNCSFANWLAATRESIAEKSKVIRTFFGRLASHYAQGGLRGAIQYIICFAKGGNSLTDDEGLLTFTDNKSLLPREFIVGILAQVVQVVSIVVSMIVACFSRVLGAILSVAATVLWSVIGSAISTNSDTRSSFTVLEDYNAEVAILPCAPLSMLQGEIDISFMPSIFQWYLDMVSLGSPVVYANVPGGILYIGPGGYSDDGSSITTIRWEFHPSTMPLDRWATRLFFSAIVSVSDDDGPRLSLTKLRKAGGSQYIANAWHDLLNYNSARDADVYNDPSTGRLSQANDNLELGSVCFSTVVFLAWIAIQNDVIYGKAAPKKDDEDYEFFIGPYITDHNLEYIMHDAAAWFGGSTAVHVSSWNDLTKCAINICNNNYRGAFSFHDTDGDGYEYKSSQFSSDVSWVIMKGNFYGEANILPSRTEYELQLPKFNSRTYWTWVAATAIATATIAAVTIVATVKFKLFAKRKRADNVARYNSVRDDYNNAVNGTKTVIDPETGEQKQVPFDVNSEEGKAYINSKYKEYKRTARINNLWARIIGGTRYDITTFYGEAADESEGVSSVDSASTASQLEMNDLLYASQEDSLSANDESQAYGPAIINLITGFDPQTA